MSKPKKIVAKKFSDSRNVPHYNTLSLMNNSQTLTNLSSFIDKTEVYYESPYAQTLSKVRSTSALKGPPSISESGVTSPLNRKFPMNLKSKISLTNSFVSKAKEQFDSNPKSKNQPLMLQQKLIDKDTYLIEIKLEEISNKHQSSGISKEILENYKECFEEIIFKDKKWGRLLSKIKRAYEDWIQSNSKVIDESQQIRLNMLEFSKQVAEEVEKNKVLHKKLEKFSREAVDLGRALDEKESNFKTLQEYLLKISNVDIEELPQDKVSWKVLVSENKSYNELCGKLKRKLKSVKKHEKRLMTLFWMLKTKGYPVEETYEDLVNNKYKQIETPVGDLSEGEGIRYEPLKNRPRPEIVPALNMETVEPNSFSDDRESDSMDSDAY